MENKGFNSEENFYSLLGEKIRAVRKQKGLDQESFGEAIGLSRTSLVNIEKGRQRPSIYQIYLMTQVLGVLLSDLIPDSSIISDKSSDGMIHWEFQIDNVGQEIQEKDRLKLLDFISVTRPIK